MIASRLFDLILLDIVMPDSDGVETLAALKDDERYRHLPVIMISSLDETDIAVRCIEIGADDYLAKPFNPVLLKARVSAGLEKKRLRDREALFVQRIQQEQKRSDELLHVIFPDEIVRELKTTNFVRRAAATTWRCCSATSPISRPSATATSRKKSCGTCRT